MLLDKVSATDASIMAGATRFAGDWEQQDLGLSPDVTVISEEGYWVN